MKKARYITLSCFLILISLVSFGCFAFVAIKRPLTQIEAIVLQIFTFSAGLAGSAIISSVIYQSIKRNDETTCTVCITTSYSFV